MQAGYDGAQRAPLRIRAHRDGDPLVIARAWPRAVRRIAQRVVAHRLRRRAELCREQRRSGRSGEKERTLINYEKTIQTAFAEVSDSLIAHQRVRESREKQESLVATLQDRLRIAYIRYQGGVDTQLNALDADRDLFQAELTLARIRLDESLSVVQLYKALGGGWR